MEKVDKLKKKIIHLRKLVNVFRYDDQYSLNCHSVDKETYIRNHKYGHLSLDELEQKMENCLQKKLDQRKNRIVLTVYENPKEPQVHSFDQIQQLLLYCFSANTKEVTFANISNLNLVEKVSVYGIEDEQLTLRFINGFHSRFDHVFGFKCQENWFYLLQNIHSIEQNVSKNEVEQMGKEKDAAKEEADDFDRTLFLLNIDQMLDHGYPLPLLNFDSYECTKVKYEKVSKSSALIAIDCEMCLTADNKHQLARVSVIGEQMNVLLDVYVKPGREVANYLTEYSGITKEHLDNATWTLGDVHKWFRDHLPSDCILVGHSLNSDLIALELSHPYVIDTSLLYNLSGRIHTKPSLKMLAKHYLNVDIQRNTTGQNGHCSVEDAETVMNLIRLKIKKGLWFGDLHLAIQHGHKKRGNGFITLNEHLRSHLKADAVFHDYPDSLQLDKFVSCHSKFMTNLNDFISISLTQKRSICMVICKGKAFINVNS